MFGNTILYKVGDLRGNTRKSPKGKVAKKPERTGEIGTGGVAAVTFNNFA